MHNARKMSGCVLRQSFEDTLTTQCSDVVADPEECSYLCALYTVTSRYMERFSAWLEMGIHISAGIFSMDADT